MGQITPKYIVYTKHPHSLGLIQEFLGDEYLVILIETMEEDIKFYKIPN